MMSAVSAAGAVSAVSASVVVTTTATTFDTAFAPRGQESIAQSLTGPTSLTSKVLHLAG